MGRPQQPRRSNARNACLTLAALVLALVATRASEPARATTPLGSRFVPIVQARLADTRAGTGFTAVAPSTIDVQVTGRSGIPTGATAVALRVAIDRATSAGFVTVWPADQPQPTTSSLNFRPAAIIGATQFVALSAGGAVRLFVLGDVNGVVVDAVGYFVDTASPVAGGRFVPVSPRRLSDSRAAGGRLAAGETRRFHVPSALPEGAPYAALVANLTVTGTKGAGFLTAFAAGDAKPETAALNFDAANQTRGALVVIPTTGNLDVFTSTATDLVIDVVGYFTNPGAAASDAGLFVPRTPERWLDTRPSQRLAAGESRVLLGDRAAGASAIVANITMVESESGWVVAHAADTARPDTSSVNSSASDPTIGNLAIVGLSTGIRLDTLRATDLTVDVFGTFTAGSAPPASSTSAGQTSGPTTTGAPLPPTCLRYPLADFNQWRADVGVPPLAESETIYRAACTWAGLIVLGDGLGHVTYTCWDPFTNTRIPHDETGGPHSPYSWRLDQFGGCDGPSPLRLGEDIAGGVNGAEAVGLWRGSEGHYRTAISTDYRTAAIAGACVPLHGCFWVAQFASAGVEDLP